MVAAAAGHIAGRVPMIAGVGRGRSATPAGLARCQSAGAGASALMIHQPPDPFVAPEGVVDYIRAVHEAGERSAHGAVPAQRHHRNAGHCRDLFRMPGVVGVKWATPNPMKLKAAMAASPEHIVWVGGLAEVWAPTFYAVGARGFTSGLINVWPERSVAISTPRWRRAIMAEARA